MNPYLLIGLEATQKSIARLFEEFRQGAYDIRPDPKRFSMREVIAHLADWEPIFRERMKTALDSPGSAIEAYDEGERAIQGDYASKNPLEQIKAWEEERKKTIDFLKSISKEDWEKTVEHPERGTLTIEDIAHTLVCHDLYHLDQLQEMLEASKVVDTW
ncbi:MAG TPA: DinB family protein [Fimbriimonadales bacterium]|nr:DinB family protein [Fimbriimonadales bacterium]